MEQRGSSGEVGVRRLRIGPQRRAFDIAVGAPETGGQFGDAGTGLASAIDSMNGAWKWSAEGDVHPHVFGIEHSLPPGGVVRGFGVLNLNGYARQGPWRSPLSSRNVLKRSICG